MRTFPSEWSADAQSPMYTTATVPGLCRALFPDGPGVWQGGTLTGHRPTSWPLGAWWTVDRIHLPHQPFKDSDGARGVGHFQSLATDLATVDSIGPGHYDRGFSLPLAFSLI